MLLDAYAVDCGSFEDWCAEFGFSSDSIKARTAYDECLATWLKLRAAFGENTLADLRELFEDM